MSEPKDLPGLEAVTSVVADLAASFRARGHRLYLVGGVVRDLLLGQVSPDEDIDLTTDARPETIKDLVRPLATALWTQGERFGTIGATVNGRDLEITTHRAEAYGRGSRKPTVAFGQSIDEDLSRRDFTINAMAISLPDAQLVDPYGGERDLARRRLATPLSPTRSFTDDPLRMLRAARFLPRFGLESEPGLESAAVDLAGRLAIVSVERVHDELERLLAVDAPARGLSFLHRTGLLVQALPALADRPDGQRTGIALAGAGPTPLTRRAGLLAALGAEAGAALDRLRYPRAVVKATSAMIEALALTRAGTDSPASVRRMVARVGTEVIPELRALARLVVDEDGRVSVGSEPLLFATYDELALSEDLDDLRSPLTGGQVMNHLDLEPGPLIGKAVEYLRTVRIERGPVTEQEGFELLDRWWGDIVTPPG